MGSNEHRFVRLDQDPQENRDCKAGDVGGVLQRTNYVSPLYDLVRSGTDG
jgi:hypothetical protein